MPLGDGEISLNPGEIANPVLTSSPTVPPPIEEESAHSGMQQTGQSRLKCREDIRRGITIGATP
jgi:serine/threonine-protein kinase